MARPAPRKLTGEEKEKLKDPKFVLALRAAKTRKNNKPPRR